MIKACGNPRTTTLGSAPTTATGERNSHFQGLPPLSQGQKEVEREDLGLPSPC